LHQTGPRVLSANTWSWIFFALIWSGGYAWQGRRQGVIILTLPRPVEPSEEAA
jgi:hypothetical protein